MPRKAEAEKERSWLKNRYIIIAVERLSFESCSPVLPKGGKITRKFQGLLPFFRFSGIKKSLRPGGEERPRRESRRRGNHLRPYLAFVRLIFSLIPRSSDSSLNNCAQSNTCQTRPQSKSQRSGRVIISAQLSRSRRPCKWEIRTKAPPPPPFQDPPKPLFSIILAL